MRETSPGRTVRRSPFGRLAVLLAVSFVGGCSKPPAAPPPPVDVEVVAVTPRDVPIRREWVATLAGFVDAQIRAQVSGYLLKQDYKEGSEVGAGDLLFEIDARPLEAQLAQAESQVAQAAAQRDKAALDVKRYTPLARSQAISQEELDNAIQARLAAEAQVKAAQAALETARLNLSFTRIVSPVHGIAGLIQTQVGDLVGPSTGALTTVSVVDPMKVYFPIDEKVYLDFAREHPSSKGFPADVRLELILSDGTEYPQAGRFYALDRQIDAGTGTLQVAAVFPNPANLLRPGQYGRVRAVVRTVKGALVVPMQALNELQGTYQAALVGPDGRVKLRTVKLGEQVGQEVIVESGLQAGDRIIVQGLQKVRDGAIVNAHLAAPPSEAAAKAPAAAEAGR